MQTFVTGTNLYTRSTLDTKRVLNQINEATVIYKALTGLTQAWINHPAVKMWAGYEDALLEYRQDMMLEAILRGYEYQWQSLPFKPFADKIYPPWYDKEEVHVMYKGLLLFKNLEHYSKYYFVEPVEKCDFNLMRSYL